ncbi:uncharacterized protein EDB93DRAFT_1250112 [Suillus bovinus]|uniref:uncharacterized protein n=1 Tax=Suillus bovinus TaxID=48563 RepID=UPI001B86338F|nr:uncharacterized protein EDB93DRAFT_1250112 [Suillus bovinus]KAG2148677.1 hypothetical protein EDB93DRAFT_1250112 [Suillus bovinus]
MGIDLPKDCYATFLRVVYEWRILNLLKCFAQGHCPDGVVTTEPGQCAVFCPACLHPGKNLPEDWKNALPDKWLYALFVGIDANFRLKQKLVSSDIVDPGISKGWLYFVEEKAYKSYLADNKNQNQECSTCTSHNAMNMANTKKSKGLAATGVGTMDCARHNMKLQNAVGDLQKGEKYVLFTIYFIILPPNNTSQPILSRARSTFLNFSRHVGHTDGEALERGWANINPIASSTKEMGPGSWCDTLDDHFGDWNWKHFAQLARLTARKLADAIKQKANHQHELLELESRLLARDISEWRTDVEAWKQDHMQPNPFKATVWLELVHIEAAELESGTNISLHADVPPSILISSGIDLEEQQIFNYYICYLCLAYVPMKNAHALLQEHLDAWAPTIFLLILLVSALASYPYPDLTLVILVILAFPFALYLSLQQSQYIWPDPFADEAYSCSVPPPD